MYNPDYTDQILGRLSGRSSCPIFKRGQDHGSYYHAYARNGFYQYIFSVASYATILDFGISSVVNTFSIKHKEQGNTEGVENVMFYALMFSVGAALLIVLGGVIIIVEAPGIFGEVVLKNLALTRMLLAIITTELIILTGICFLNSYIAE